MKVICIKTGNKVVNHHITMNKIYNVLSCSESKIAKYYPSYGPNCGGYIIDGDEGEVLLIKDHFITLREYSLNILGI